MTFSLGLLELFGYLVPGGVVLTAVLLVSRDACELLDRSKDNVGIALLLLLGVFLAGHLLSIASRSLTTAKRWLRGHRRRDYPFYPALKRLLNEFYGIDFGEAEVFHQSRLVALRADGGQSGQVARYFAIGLLSRNLAASFAAAAGILAADGRGVLTAMCVIGGVAFAFQHYRFDGTFESTMFRTAFQTLVEADRERNRRDAG